MTEAEMDLVGYLDGYRQGAFDGWVWMPHRPGHRVEIEILVNGFKVVKAVASDYRPDLIAAGIGDGRHAFNVPLEVDTRQSGPVQVVVRTTDGRVLGGGEITLGDEPPPTEAEAAAFKAFVAAVLSPSGESLVPEPGEPAPPMNFFVFAPKAEAPVASTLGTAEYSYTFVMNAFVPMLERLGTVHVVDDPAREVDLLYKIHLSLGENALFLSFAPPHRTVLGLLCPTIPVIAWEFPTIPSAVWDGEARHDWRHVLRQVGRVITLSTFAQAAVKAAMGAEFPVTAIPAPIWDRHPLLQAGPRYPVAGERVLAASGLVFDTRGREFTLETVIPPVPDMPAADAVTALHLDGIVFTSMFSPVDGRKNWPDLLTAFVIAFAEQPAATLVLKMISVDAACWWEKLQTDLRRLPKFSCRIVVLQGYLDAEHYAALIAASDWVVNASSSEGLCMPLVEFMCGGRPVIAPCHTAMVDYHDAANGLIVASAEEYCAWPHDPRNKLTTTRHRVAWSALSASFAEGFEISVGDPARYRLLSDAARATAAAFCSDAVVGAKLSSFLGLARAEPATAVSTLLQLSEAV